MWVGYSTEISGAGGGVLREPHPHVSYNGLQRVAFTPSDTFKNSGDTLAETNTHGGYAKLDIMPFHQIN